MGFSVIGSSMNSFQNGGSAPGLQAPASQLASSPTLGGSGQWASLVAGKLQSPQVRPNSCTSSLCPSLFSRSDTSLYCDDVDIRFSKTMNSCKVLQIRYASVGRLLERLTDLRFLSIDFLNTFLHSYRVFTTAMTVLDKLITIYKKPISAIPARWVFGSHMGEAQNRQMRLRGEGGREKERERRRGRERTRFIFCIYGKNQWFSFIFNQIIRTTETSILGKKSEKGEFFLWRINFRK